MVKYIGSFNPSGLVWGIRVTKKNFSNKLKWIILLENASVFQFKQMTVWKSTQDQSDQEKSPNVYKSCLKMISLQKW